MHNAIAKILSSGGIKTATTNNNNSNPPASNQANQDVLS